MRKPKIGSTIWFAGEGLDIMPSSGEVVAVFDTIYEDWGEYGHEAMGAEEVPGHEKSEWFAVVETEYERAAICSFEVKEGD